MKTDCRQYRISMELLSLRLRLEKGIADPRERREVEERIHRLEKDLRLE